MILDNDTYFPVVDVKPAPATKLNSSEYNYEQIQSKELNAMGLFGDGIKVGIIDSGCVQGVFKYRNFTKEADGDLNGHGSHVASIILNIAPGATIYMAKAMGHDGGGSMEAVIKATQWLLDEGVHIINCSFGFNAGVKVTEYEKLVTLAAERGVIFVCASGNEGADAALFPGSHSKVFCVGAIDKHEKITNFSNTGTAIDLVAPGKDILGVGLNGLMLMSGTSQATPHVTGMLILYMGKYGVKRFEELYNDITRTSVKDLGKVGDDYIYGFGLIKGYFAGLGPGIKKKDGWLTRLLRKLFG